jgi:hypothetical protein
MAGTAQKTVGRNRANVSAMTVGVGRFEDRIDVAPAARGNDMLLPSP